MATSLAGSAQMEPSQCAQDTQQTTERKCTLLQFNTKMFITKALEDYTEMGKMVSKQLTEHQDII